MFRGCYARLAILGAAGLAACGGNDVVLPNDRLAAKIVATRGDNQTGTVGGALADSAVVRVTDAKDQPVSGQTVTFSVISGGGSVSPRTATTDANGLAGTRWTLGSVAGAQQVKAQATGNGAPANVSVLINASAGASAATAIALVSGDNQTGTAGSPLVDSLVVKATDVDGNPVAGAAVQWTVTGGGTVSAAATPTGADGHAAVKRTLGPSAGAQTAVATAAGLTGSPITFHSTATVGSAGQLVITRQPSSTASSGVAFATQPQVQLEDANGNPVAQAGIAVQAEITSGPAGALVNATAATDASGRATFAGLTITGPAGSYNLSFFGTAISGAASNPITLSAGAVSRLGFAVAPSATAQSGVPLVQQPQVQLEDAAGNPVSQAGVNIAVSVSAGGSLSGATTVATDASGVAAFTDLAVGGATGTYSLKFASGPINTSASVTLGAGNVDGSKSSYTVTGGPITASNGSSTATVAIVARDASGNAVAGAAPSVGFCGGSSSAPATDGSGASSIAVSCAKKGDNQSVSVSINGTPVTNPAGTHTLTVNAAASTTTLAANPAGGSSFGQEVTFTATVTGGVNPPAGTVTFKDGGNTIGNGAVDGSGHATVQTTTLSATTHSITASYTGDGSYAPSTSAALSYDVSVLGTTTTVTSSDLNAVFSENVTFTATVTGLLPGGNVTFKDGASTLGTATVNPANGVATFSTPALTVTGSPHSITAEYSGDDGHAPSTSAAISQTVAVAATTTAVTSTGSPTNSGDDITVSFTVSVTPPGAGAPTGTVTVTLDDGQGTTATCQHTLTAGESGSGSCTVIGTAFASGLDLSVTAQYGGEPNDFSVSTSAVVLHHIN
jgi:hypothetical protein